MRNVLNRALILGFVTGFLLLTSFTAKANDYLELQKHYMVYTSGANSIHFKIPVWAYGKSYDYYLGGDTCRAEYIVQTKNANGETVDGPAVTLCYFRSERYGENEKKDTQKGTAWLKMAPGQGMAVVTSMYNGSHKAIYDTGEWSDQLIVKQVESDDCPQVTMLEFDWYPPESLNEKSFTICLRLAIYASLTNNMNYPKNFLFTGPFTGANNLMAPQLSEPYLYTVNGSGVTGYGQAAVQYTTFQKPIWYVTSKSPKDTVKISDRSGSIYINTTDTVQESFTATFGVYRDEAVNNKTQLTTPPVDIPPFHRIYNFQAIEEKDSMESLTGNNVLQWEIKNPELKDIVDNDYFEIQRATKSDFSNAQTLNVMQMRRGSEGKYTFVDDTHTTQTNTSSNSQTDTLNNWLSANHDGYILRDAYGNPMCELNLVLFDNRFILPSAPVYYRIRRAASSLWGWNHDFTKSATVNKHNYLAPLAAEQTNYRKDDKFEENHMVHFDIKLDNMQIGYHPISVENCQLTYKRGRTLSDTLDYIVEYNPVTLDYRGYYSDTEEATIYVYACTEDEEVFGPMPGKKLSSNKGTLRIPRDSRVVTTVRPKYPSYEYHDTVYSFVIKDHIEHHFQFHTRSALYLVCTPNWPYMPGMDWNTLLPAEKQRIQEIETSIKQAALPDLLAKNESFGRCVWDKTARLLLCKTNIEAGTTIEIIVPQDSIRRQADGSWIAHMTDVAGEPCTNYSYAVRIDQSDASIHVSDSVYLRPKPLYGPSLYFDESATITSFTASQGEAKGNMKNGIRLSWIASSAAVDEFLLTRIVKDSDMVPDTIIRTVDTNYFDESAKPDVHYEYTVTAYYACNGKNTSHSASTEGWRTPYGQISGNIFMPDNSGMANVQVSISANGQTLKTITTDASGAFLFDSLKYDLVSGTAYTISPTSQYGVFSYNNTSSGVASVSLADNQAIVSSVNFVNTSAVRISGRILYKNSTIPVAGVAFILNGDTVRRGGAPLLSAIDGSFELSVPKSQMLTLQATKAGHTFEGEGILRPESNSDQFSLVKALDGVRFYDATMVRLVGRVAGGSDQQALKHGFGLGKNNLGDNIQLVLMLEGDNTAHIVHDPDDLTRDTLHYAIGGTETVFEQKRITIKPDPATGEYAVDIFPVKYKVVQATATGYATLFPTGTGSETFDLTNAPLTVIRDTLSSDNPNAQPAYVQYNAVYDRIYHNPVQVRLTQLNYGMEADGLGEAQIQVNSLTPLTDNTLPLYTKQANGEVNYLLGHPVFRYNRRYQFLASAFEEYLYNNEPSGAVDRVPLRSGSVTIQNGMSKSVDRQTYQLDSNGRNKGIWLTVDHMDVQSSAENALRTVSIALQSESNTIEAVAFRAFVEGTLIQPEALQSTEADITLLDILRDPGGNGSSAYVESGTTYKFAYTESYYWKAGVVLTPTWSAGLTQDIGMVSAPAGAGSYIGATYSSKRELSFDIPIVNEWKWGYKYDYTFTTTDRITTSTGKSKMGVGANADVFIGATTSQFAGKAKSIALISDSLYQARQPAIQAGVMKVLAQGSDTVGNHFYLVTGEKVVMGSQITNTFVYSQGYIYQTIIPTYILQRQNLLMDFNSEEEAQNVADATGQPVYWNLRTAPVNMHDTLTNAEYKMIVPNNGNAYVDRIKALDNIIMKWTTLIYTNEKEKIMARTSGEFLGTFSVNYGNTFTHSDSYSGMANYNRMPQGWGLYLSEIQAGLVGVVDDVLKSLTNSTSNFRKGFKSETIGKSVADAVKDYYKYENGFNLGKKEDTKLGTKTNSSEFEMEYTPVIEFDCDDNLSIETTQKKNTGFTIVSDAQGDITVSVYRAKLDSVWKHYSENIRDNTEAGDNLLYGSYVFFTQAGSSFCPYEPEERTMLYNEGTLLSNATEHIAKPELSINTYELTNIPSDQRAKFRVEIKNAGQVETGLGSSGQMFELSFDGASNPNGAKVYLNGAPLVLPVGFFIPPGQTVSQVIEVEKGEVDDYENLQLFLTVADCPKNNTRLNFSVHFLPESSPVNMAFPRDKWVMNTLSAKDSIGYYLPVTIDGFNIQHKNFDHIEFQYKLSTENDDAWVNQCSFFADDSLYALASGNKAMIENGRIMPFRFYGERDPKELNYDLRAVSFCRHGSGFVTKSSPVVSGTKDTRPPVLFGKAQPANGILTLEDNISMRFSEPIAGNWLDEDNNFQILGVTNATGITQTTSLYFDGVQGHNATTKAKRELAVTDLTIDMLIKPAERGREMTMISHGDDQYSFDFSLTSDNRLKLTMFDNGKLRDTRISKPMSELSTADFTRVIMVYNFDKQSVRFYAGTLDITDNPSTTWLLQNNAETFTLGAAHDGSNPFHGNIMEVRVWTKPLTTAEISNTHLRHLTGYEYGLMDYYPLNESKGQEMTDLASGATLYANGLSWTTPQGISLSTTGSPVRLQPTLFSRTEAEDYSLLFWFRSNNEAKDTVSLFGTAMGDSVTMQIALHDGEILYKSGSVDISAMANLNDGVWHHCALIISKTFNAGSLAIDGNKLLMFSALQTSPLGGTNVWMAKGLNGHIDDVCLFEQPLPSELVNEFGKQSPNGEEMGLINLLTFSQIKRNESNVQELVFSPNNQRVFRDANGNKIVKEQPLLIDDLSAQSDKNNSAPIRDRGQLTQLPFTWNYQLSDLLINIKAQPREINKRTMYLTVRDVEDVNGNRLTSPVMWTVYADLNSVRWDRKSHEEILSDNELTHRFTSVVTNHTGMTRQYNIENLPEWLTVSPAYGTLEAEEERTVTFSINAEKLKIGLHTHIIYLTDDQGLAEPLLIEVRKESDPPYTDVDLNKYPFNMSLCGVVLVEEAGKSVVNTSEDDYVYALYNNECIGVAHCNVNGKLYLTIHGNNSMTRKVVRFQLWKASTGKIYNLTADRVVLFTHGSVYGCGEAENVVLTAGSSEMQNITLTQGWNWISIPLNMQATKGKLNSSVTAEQPWSEGDIIKNPATRQFSSYNEASGSFSGTLHSLNYRQMYMVNVATDNSMHVFGEALSEDSMNVQVRGGGQWSPLPCLFDKVTSLRDALAGYYDNASTGDLIKSHTRFATFTDDKRWVGDLTALTPGEGYLFRRIGSEAVTIPFHKSGNLAPRQTPAFRGNAATNMTLIAKLEANGEGLRAYLGDQLVGVATKIDSLYFLTVSSDQEGALRFETEDGMPLVANDRQPILYVPDSHHGSLHAPVLMRQDDSRPYKIIENYHVIIIRNNERYDVTGKKL